MALALKYHEAGNFFLAEHLCRQVLQADSTNADAWCFLGAACDAQGKSAEAQTHYRRAIQLKPDYAAAHYNLGLALEHEGRLGQAAACYRQALHLHPHNVAALNNLGNTLKAQGHLDEAIACYRRTVNLNPEIAEWRVNLGNALAAMENLEEAIREWREALRLRPGLAEVHASLASAFLRQGQFKEAETWFRQWLEIEPSSAIAHHGLGHALENQGKYDEAISSIRQALTIKPDFAQAFNSLGNVLQQQDKLEEAGACYREALQLDPHSAEAYNGLGHCLERQGKVLEAIDNLQRAIRLRPTFAEPFNNLANIHKEQGHFDQALAFYDQALERNAAFPVVHFNRAVMRLLVGKWTEGWAEYEWRWQIRGFARLPFRQPRWDGSDLKGRHILVVTEQGLGDTLQFIRFVPLILAKGGRVTVQCQPPLRRLLATCLATANVAIQDSPPAEFDVFVPLLSVPGILGTTKENVPAYVPYLHADRELAGNWQRALAGVRGFKIGICWQGTVTNTGDRQRSIPLKHFACLAKIDGVQLISLQKGPGKEQLGPIANQFSVLDFGDRLDENSGPFMDSAALMTSLDLVISTDTSIAHLAGALAVPVWVPLLFVPDWRWLLERQDSPWYPTMRLFRQVRQGDWEEVFARIAQELESVGKAQTQIER